MSEETKSAEQAVDDESRNERSSETPKTAANSWAAPASRTLTSPKQGAKKKASAADAETNAGENTAKNGSTASSEDTKQALNPPLTSSDFEVRESSSVSESAQYAGEDTVQASAPREASAAEVGSAHEVAVDAASETAQPSEPSSAESAEEGASPRWLSADDFAALASLPSLFGEAAGDPTPASIRDTADSAPKSAANKAEEPPADSTPEPATKTEPKLVAPAKADIPAETKPDVVPAAKSAPETPPAPAPPKAPAASSTPEALRKPSTMRPVGNPAAAPSFQGNSLFAPAQPTAPAPQSSPQDRAPANGSTSSTGNAGAAKNEEPVAEPLGDSEAQNLTSSTVTVKRDSDATPLPRRSSAPRPDLLPMGDQLTQRSPLFQKKDTGPTAKASSEQSAEKLPTPPIANESRQAAAEAPAIQPEGSYTPAVETQPEPAKPAAAPKAAVVEAGLNSERPAAEPQKPPAPSTARTQDPAPRPLPKRVPGASAKDASQLPYVEEPVKKAPAAKHTSGRPGSLNSPRGGDPALKPRPVTPPSIPARKIAAPAASTSTELPPHLRKPNLPPALRSQPAPIKKPAPPAPVVRTAASPAPPAAPLAPRIPAAGAPAPTAPAVSGGRFPVGSAAPGRAPLGPAVSPSPGRAVPGGPMYPGGPNVPAPRPASSSRIVDTLYFAAMFSVVAFLVLAGVGLATGKFQLPGSSQSAANCIPAANVVTQPYQVSVRVLNGSSKAGLAKAVGEELTARKFVITSLDNGVETPGTAVAVIRHAPNALTQAKLLQVNIAGEVKLIEDAQVTQGVDLILQPQYSQLVSVADATAAMETLAQEAEAAACQ